MANQLSLETSVHVNRVEIVYSYFFFKSTHEQNLIALGVEQGVWNPHSLKVNLGYNLSIVVIVNYHSCLRSTHLIFVVLN